MYFAFNLLVGNELGFSHNRTDSIINESDSSYVSNDNVSSYVFISGACIIDL